MGKTTQHKLVAYISPELKPRLEALAKADRRSLSSFVEILCEDAVARAEQNSAIPKLATK